MSAFLRLIPVLDLMQGVAVRARGGRRDEYRPLESRLSPTSRPEDLVEGLLDLHPFTTLYVADLDAIQGRGDHASLLERLGARFPELELWVDGGFSGASAAARWQARGLGRPVLGSESLDGLPARGELPAGAILSLDYRAQGYTGPAGLETAPEHWPADVILMILGRVGMGRGPDLETLARFRGLAPATRFFAAGGVRHLGDLEALAEAGAAGVLLASALHDGYLSPDALAAFHAGPPGEPARGARRNGPGPDR